MIPPALASFVYEQILFRGEAAALDELAIGASRIAGPPDLPDDLEWPRAPSGRALPLVLQLRLADLPRCPATARLPADGTLWCFAAQLEGGESAAVPSAIRYAPASAMLRRRTLPPEATDDAYWDRVQVARLVEVRPNRAFEREEVFDELHLSSFAALDAADQDALRALDQPADTEPDHVIFPLRQVGAYGVDPPDGWISLIELRSDDAIGMSWGDAAWISFRVPADDLARAHFTRGEGHVWIG